MRIREFPSGALVAETRDANWRLLGWGPDGERIAVTESGLAVVLNAASLQRAPGETYAWNPPTPVIDGCTDAGAAVWNPARTLAAVPSSNDVAIASVSDHNYVRVWNPESLRCFAISEDYPYPRASYFSDEQTLTMVDIALRRYSMSASR